MIYITEAPINTQEVIKAAQSDSAGAVNVFIGTVRNKTSERDVLRLEYEAYDAMAVKEMGKIIEQAKEKERIFRFYPFDQSLKTHKLSGKNSGCWAFWINYSYRVKFIFINPSEILFLEVGLHNIYN